jgi:hypothetical protein
MAQPFHSDHVDAQGRKRTYTTVEGLIIAPNGVEAWRTTSGGDVPAEALEAAFEASNSAAIAVTFDAGAEVLSTGVKGFVTVPFACTIDSVTALANTSGSIVVDVWKDTYANFPPTDADTITASAPITISSAVKATDSTLTGWTTAIAAGDVLGFNIDSVTSINRLNLTIAVTKG